MKPRCFSCLATMKVVYVRVNQLCVKIKDYYHCNNCNKTKRIVKQDILLSDIIAKNGIRPYPPNKILYALNLRIHQYKFDFWVNDRKKDILDMCRTYILAQIDAHGYRSTIKQGSWDIEFIKNGIVHITLTDERSFLESWISKNTRAIPRR